VRAPGRNLRRLSSSYLSPWEPDILLLKWRISGIDEGLCKLQENKHSKSVSVRFTSIHISLGARVLQFCAHH
jgi:hypothetical protein